MIHRKTLLIILILIGSASTKEVECAVKFIAKITKICTYGIAEEKIPILLSKCCSTHCSKAHLKMFCTMKKHTNSS
ncbi:unnamed protein product [Caenorhabditis sp. 36 PRJEB53466]|nr:unnamed protein product [Caenorhabditis sp. 36 PRJEB53466]